MFTSLKILLAILPLLTLIPTSVAADFSRSQAELHPLFPGAGPFIIEISGIWPTDCHPGEQKPVVESFDGHSVQVGFEIIVVHITCNVSDTPYRVLVDMSEALRSTKARGDSLEVLVNFSENDLRQTLDLVCPQDRDCVNLEADQRLPDPGIYHAPGLANQGLLVARQNTATAIFPLVYDESGGSEWLFAGNRMTGDSFFSEVLRPSGGDCFGCEPGDALPEMTPIGHLSVLADRPGVLQVKFNDGLFTQYESLVFGYHIFPFGDGVRPLIDIEGRWGISENRGTDPPLGDLTEFLPGAFDIELEDIVRSDNPDQPIAQVNYLVRTLTGDTLGQLLCKGQTGLDGASSVCEFIDHTDVAEPLFLFFQQGPSTLSIEYGRALIAVGIAPGGKAVRLD
jgi:hypothetical protein